MEGDVTLIADQPQTPTASSSSVPEHVRKEQEKWSAWKANEGVSRTEAKRRYIQLLIDTMHKFASNTPEARELVEELEFVWEQVKSNSLQASSGSEHSSPMRAGERSGYIQDGSLAVSGTEGMRGGMRILSPVSQADEEDIMDEEREEFVDAPELSQMDEGDLQDVSDDDDVADVRLQASTTRRSLHSQNDNRWRKRIESSLVKLTTEIAALREITEYRRYDRNKRTLFGWILRLSWWAVQLVVADAVLLWFVILYLRRKDDRRLEGAVRVLLGDAVAQVQKVRNQVKVPGLERVAGKKGQT